jgi:hypothetical protein
MESIKYLYEWEKDETKNWPNTCEEWMKTDTQKHKKTQ